MRGKKNFSWPRTLRLAMDTDMLDCMYVSVLWIQTYVSAFIHTESACDINDILGRNVEPAEGEAVLR